MTVVASIDGVDYQFLSVRNARMAARYYRTAVAFVYSTHAFLECILLGWAYVLADGLSFQSSRLYSLMSVTWPYTPHGWAWLFLLASVAGLPGFLPLRTGWWRHSGTILLSLAHGQIGYFTLVANHYVTTGSTTYGACFAFSLFWTSLSARLVPYTT